MTTMKIRQKIRLTAGSTRATGAALLLALYLIAAEMPAGAQIKNEKYGQEDKFRQLEEILPTPNDYRAASGSQRAADSGLQDHFVFGRSDLVHLDTGELVPGKQNVKQIAVYTSNLAIHFRYSLVLAGLLIG